LNDVVNRNKLKLKEYNLKR